MPAIARKTAICLATLLLFSLCAAAAPKEAKELQIGTFTFVGTTDPNCGSFCGTGYEALIDAETLSSDVLSFGDVVVCIGTICQHSGPFSTWAIPGVCGNCLDLTFPAGDPGDILPDCAKVACRSIDLQLVSATGQPFSLTLLDGTTFTTYAVNTTTMKALPGQHVLQPAPSNFGPFQSVPIMLARDHSGK